VEDLGLCDERDDADEDRRPERQVPADGDRQLTSPHGRELLLAGHLHLLDEFGLPGEKLDDAELGDDLGGEFEALVGGGEEFILVAEVELANVGRDGHDDDEDHDLRARRRSVRGH